MRYGATDAVDAAASRDRGDGVTALVLGVIAVALAAAIGVYGYTQWWRAEDLKEQRAAATQAARQIGVNLASLDYRQVQKGIDRVLAGTTGNAKNQVATQAKAIADGATQNQAVFQVNQVRAGVISMDGDSADVMVSIIATTTNTKVKQGAQRYFRWEMGLTRVDDRWLVSRMGLAI
jgi:Mce-associated membrane protein